MCFLYCVPYMRRASARTVEVLPVPKERVSVWVLVTVVVGLGSSASLQDPQLGALTAPPGGRPQAVVTLGNTDTKRDKTTVLTWWSVEQEVRQPPSLDELLNCSCNVVVRDDLVERLGTVLFDPMRVVSAHCIHDPDTHHDVVVAPRHRISTQLCPTHHGRPSLSSAADTALPLPLLSFAAAIMAAMALTGFAGAAGAGMATGSSTSIGSAMVERVCGVVYEIKTKRI